MKPESKLVSLAHTHSKSRLNHVLDMLASRVGIATVVGFLTAVCVAIGLYLQSVLAQLEVDHDVFRDAQVRNGYVAMSDINRLVLVAQNALLAGEMSPERAADFRDAVDILFVRVDNFKMVMERGGNFSFGPDSIAALEQIVEVADAANTAGFPDLLGLVQDLVIGGEKARQSLVKFLDAARRQGDMVLELQSYAVRRQQVVVLASLVGLAVVGCAALLFLRREVLGRRAREQAEQRVEFLAFFDSLTALPNRVQFQDKLCEKLRRNRPMALLFVDLDDFKLINDTYGHLAGDAVLCRVGAIFARLAMQQNGFAARLGGDEFAIAVPSDNEARLKQLCETLIEEANAPFSYNGETFIVGLSIGLATSTQLSGQMTVDLDSLSRVTDFALYAAKGNGRNQFTFYNHDLEKKFLERRAMLDELPKAISEQDLEIYLQPKVDLAGHTVYGFEALVRWRREGHIVAPSEFIHIAEESGLVVDIDDAVLNQATDLVAKWNADHATCYSVSVNLSTLHLNSQRIVERVQDALWQSALDPDLLTLEITESMEIRDWKQAHSVINALHKVGCKIALDDFGTGFSSLAYLRTAQADELKIDKSLVDEVETSEDAQLLLSSVFDIARNLNLSIVVEGIETREQSEIVQQMGAQHGQGYLFGRPLPAAEALSAADQANRCLDRDPPRLISKG